MSKRLCICKKCLPSNKDTSIFYYCHQDVVCQKEAWLLPKLSNTYRTNAKIQLEHSEEHSATIRDIEACVKTIIGQCPCSLDKTLPLVGQCQ